MNKDELDNKILKILKVYGDFSSNPNQHGLNDGKKAIHKLIEGTRQEWLAKEKQARIELMKSRSKLISENVELAHILAGKDEEISTLKEQLEENLKVNEEVNVKYLESYNENAKLKKQLNGSEICRKQFRDNLISEEEENTKLKDLLKEGKEMYGDWKIELMPTVHDSVIKYKGKTVLNVKSIRVRCDVKNPRTQAIIELVDIKAECRFSEGTILLVNGVQLKE